MTQTREQNAANETTGISGGGWNSPAYDAAGSMVSGPKAGNEAVRLHFVYDAWNRLVQVKADSGGQPGAVIATYQYDGRGFRTRKVLNGGDTFDYYYNEEHQVVEVRRNGDADAYEQYVWDARYIDAPVMVYRDTNTDGTVDQNLYVMQDANFNTTATLNGASGAVINRFTYTPYGRRTVLNSAWAAATTDVTLGHQGLSLDAETGLYYNRARMLHPTLGVFTGRDPLGYVDGGNLYQYVGNGPVDAVDPSGRISLGKKIGSIYSWRNARALVPLPKIKGWDRTTIGQDVNSKSSPYRLSDSEQEVARGIEGQMAGALRSMIEEQVANGHPVGEEWSSIEVSGNAASFVRGGALEVRSGAALDAGWWLHAASNVPVTMKAEIRRKCGSLTVRNITVKGEWVDRIDSNPTSDNWIERNVTAYLERKLTSDFDLVVEWEMGRAAEQPLSNNMHLIEDRQAPLVILPNGKPLNPLPTTNPFILPRPQRIDPYIFPDGYPAR